MSNSPASVFEAETTAPIPWRRITFWILSGLLAAIGICVLILCDIYQGGGVGFWEFMGIFGVTFALIFGLYMRMRSWYRRNVKFRLEGSQLQIVTTCDDDKPFPGFSKTYDLDTLIIVQTVNAHEETEKNNQITMTPRRLLLMFRSEGNGREQQVWLTHDQVRGPSSDRRALSSQLDKWNELCGAIDAYFASSSLADRWTRTTPYARYKLVLQQAETAFLQAPPTATRMCRASLRAVTDLVGSGQELLHWAFWSLGIVGVSTAIVAGMIDWLLPRIGLGDWLNPDTKDIPGWALYLIIASPVIGVMVAAVRFFQPLSTRLQSDAVRELLAQQLVLARATKEDLDSLLKFAKDDLDRFQAELTRYTVVAALSGAMTPLFNQSLETWASAILLLLIALIFVIIQLYFSAQMQILRLTMSICLIAQSQAPSAVANPAR